MTRKDLITSREYWVSLIAQSFYDTSGCKDENMETFERMAESAVSNLFMTVIMELADGEKNNIESPKEFATCEDCSGNGSRLGGRTSTSFICPTCNGTGKIPIKQ